jgi:cytochrome c-type biogenesis protein CcmH
VIRDAARFPSFRRKPQPVVPLTGESNIDPGLRRSDGTWARRALIVLCLFACMLAHAIDPLPFKDRAEELRFQALTKQLRCLVCQNESLADSNAPLAADLRRDVFEQMQSGKSDDEIKAWLTARYSDFVLYDPPLHAATSLLWFGPLLLVLAGAIAVVVIVRRRAQAAPSAARTPRPPDAEDDW